MSELGQSRHSDYEPVTSGLASKADIFSAGRHVTKVPEGDVLVITLASDHLAKSSARRNGSNSFRLDAWSAPTVCRGLLRRLRAGPRWEQATFRDTRKLDAAGRLHGVRPGERGIRV
jgi:hypothetical protein